MAADARRLRGTALAGALGDARARTWALVDDLDERHWRPPQQAGVNPIAWELAHVAWFAEFWTTRGPHHFADGLVHAVQAPRHAGPDAHLDSARLPHARRWDTPLPERARLREMHAAQLEATRASIPSDSGGNIDSDSALYLHRLALFHEDMHGEAFAWLRAAVGLPPPPGAALPLLRALPAVQVGAADVSIGWPAGEAGFAFDNEGHGQRVALETFEIDATPVSAGAFLRFVESGGYDQPAHWRGAAATWRAQAARSHPERWRRGAGGWQVRWFDHWQPLEPDAPVIHVNAYEAEAFCAWAGRRLPRAAEWEAAAALQAKPGRAKPGEERPTHGGPEGNQFTWGHSVWEWTADNFEPYPGFRPGPYRDYSAPWFGDHRELRGGAFATHERMHHPRYRNFFLPERADVFAGFRTCAI